VGNKVRKNSEIINNDKTFFFQFFLITQSLEHFFPNQ